MAAFTTSNVSTSLVGRELSIASSFVKQYYTLLNKAPCYIHNFYSQDSTFIHGTIEMANEHYAEPVIGREKIKQKVEDLKLNDCRAKIKQIDCLETLAGGLVIQVIGELSNNGKPMRRFLQTFVLAPSPEDSASRQDGDSQHVRAAGSGSSSADRRGVNMSENNSNTAHGSSQNEKFFVLNSIFRYQDDGPDSEFEDDVASINANISIDSTNGGNNETSKADLAKQSQGNQIQASNPNGATVSDHSQNRRRPQEVVVRSVDEVEKITSALDEGVKLSNSGSMSANKPIVEAESAKRDVSGPKVVPNGTGSLDKKFELSEKSTENGKLVTENPQTTNSSAGSTVAVSSQQQQQQQPVPAATASRPQPSNEPKTWANMVRNAHPPTASVQINVNKVTVPAASDQQPQQNQNSSQSSSAQTHQQQTQPQQQQPPPSLQNNGRRRHMMRKPSNKSNGRPIKNRPRPPVTGRPVA